MLRVLLSTILALHILIGHLPNISIVVSKSLEFSSSSIKTSENETCGMACCTNKTEVGGCSCCKKETKQPITVSFLTVLPSFPFLVDKEFQANKNLHDKGLAFEQESMSSLCSCSEASFNGLIKFLGLPEKSASLIKPSSSILFTLLYFDYHLTNKPSSLYLRSPPFLI